MPMFSPDGRSLSAIFGQPLNPSVVQIFDTATGDETVEHLVMLDHRARVTR
jgi:hypothetical protein